VTIRQGRIDGSIETSDADAGWYFQLRGEKEWVGPFDDARGAEVAYARAKQERRLAGLSSRPAETRPVQATATPPVQRTTPARPIDQFRDAVKQTPRSAAYADRSLKRRLHDTAEAIAVGLVVGLSGLLLLPFVWADAKKDREYYVPAVATVVAVAVGLVAVWRLGLVDSMFGRDTGVPYGK